MLISSLFPTNVWWTPWLVAWGMDNLYSTKERGSQWLPTHSLHILMHSRFTTGMQPINLFCMKKIHLAKIHFLVPLRYDFKVLSLFLPLLWAATPLSLPAGLVRVFGEVSQSHVALSHERVVHGECCGQVVACVSAVAHLEIVA